MMTAVDWHERVRSLADELAASGTLRTKPWRDAFESVPRHVLVPRFYLQDPHDSNHWETIEGAPHEEKWLKALYSDDVLVTQIAEVTGPAELGGQVHVRATSSTTMPSVMIDMLEALDVADGHRVLEIGTGTGYNAALLCARLGEDHVVSVDIHPDLVDAARTLLATLGYHPTLAVTDGAGGLPDSAPYDRIIATCSVSVLPPAWITQLAPGGILVADVRGDIGGGLVKLHKVRAETVEGGFLPISGSFMRLRPDAHNPLHRSETLGFALDAREIHETTTRVDPDLLDDPHFGFLVQLHMPGVRLFPPSDGAYLLFAEEDVWAEANRHPTGAGAYRVTYAGDRNLWEAVEQAYDLWERADFPQRDRYRLCATPDHQNVRLDTENQRWELPLA